MAISFSSDGLPTEFPPRRGTLPSSQCVNRIAPLPAQPSGLRSMIGESQPFPIHST